MGLRRARAGWVGSVVVLLVAGAAVPVGAASVGDDPGPVEWWDDVEPSTPEDDPVPPPPLEVESAPLVEDTPFEADLEAKTLPEAGAVEVTLGVSGVAREVPDAGIEVAAAGSAAAGETVRVEVLDQAVSERAGVRGFAFKVSGEDDSAFDSGAALPATVSVDYSGFKDLYGANYAGRLQVMALPECAFLAQVPEGCDLVGERLPSRNELADERLVVDIADLREVQAAPAAGLAAEPDGGGMVLALVAGPEDETGSFKATTLSMSGDWQVGIGSGEFSWSYEMPVREAVAGPTPDLGLVYSSGAIDGMVTSRNAQAGRNGLGWSDFAGSFIERRYNSCLDDDQTYGDLCWASDNATISLNGQSSELVPTDPPANTSWVLKDDPRWRVERLTGAANGDDDGEHWRVTTPDGTQYWFGLGDNPDWTPFPTDSVSTVPVVGDDPDEPCHGETLNWCVDQAWRWNLDRVIDTNGNTQTWEYEPEVNNYLSAHSGTVVSYVKGARLETVSYGTRAGSADDAQARVEFIGAYRCSTLQDDEDQTPCPAAVPGSLAEDFPDVPVDLLCGATCTVTSPTFFSIWRYARVEFYVRTPAWTLVNTVRLTHEFQDPDDNPSTPEGAKLWLSGIQRTGHHPVVEPNQPPATLTLPATTFEPITLDNRFDTAGGTLPAMPHWRIAQVTDEFGRQIDVTYGQPDECPDPIPVPPDWDLNTKNCFPQFWAPEGQPAGFGVFNKWLVTQVEESDTTGGSPAMVTSYAYGEEIAAVAPAAWDAGRDKPEGAWHHDRDLFVPNSDQSWSEWRGYEDVLVTQGATRTRYKRFRGMDGDRLAGDPFPGPGSRQATISSLDGTVMGTDDANWLTGRTLDEASLRPDGTTEQGVVHAYHMQLVADAEGPDPLDDARWVAENDTVERSRTPAVGTVFARQRTQTTYNLFFRFPEQVIEHGWTDQTGDERCTDTGYVTNAAAFMLDYPANTTRHANTTCTGAEVTRAEIAYDGAAIGTGPSYPGGNPTTTRTKVTASPETWATTTTTYDALGRPLVVTDPNGHTTTAAYNEATGGYPDQIDITNHLGHTQQTLLLPAWGVPYATVDANAKTTEFAYDPLGRVTEVRQPTEVGGPNPSWQFIYDIAPGRDEPPVIQTRQLQDTNGPSGTARYLDTWVLFDSLLRERQSHIVSPASTPEDARTIVSDTTYDDRGMVAAANLPQAVAGTAGSGLLAAPGAPPTWDNRTVMTYDATGRPIEEDFFVGTSATPERTTTTAYTHDSQEVTPPRGGNIRTITDAYERTTSVAEHDGTAYRTTAYTYDTADRLVSVTDPANNTITYTYDMAGRRTAMDDPDTGDWEYGYDPAGNQTSVTDALDDVVVMVYDDLNRPFQRREDSPIGDVLASWAYDATGELGLLDSTSRFTPEGEWIVNVDGYDDRDRPTGRTWTVPAGVTGLADDYTVTYGYDSADHQTQVTYPAVGGLALEEVTTVYNSIGQPETMAGDDDYVSTAVYDDRSRPLLFAFGSAGSPSLGKTWTYNTNQELSATSAAATGGAPVQSRSISYDKAGNVTQRDSSLTTALGTATTRECNGYDQRQRLTSAYTTTTATTCASGANQGTGPAPYDHTYTYTHDGNIDARTEGATNIDYTYPVPGPTSTRPHAPTDVGTDSYTWDANGNLDTRTIGGQTEDFAWDAERRLAAVDTPTGDSSFVYDADGTRLLRDTESGTTFYFEGHEVTAPAAGPVAAVRSYGFGGMPVAVRDGGGVSYLVTDNQGSVEATVPTGATTADVTRTYLPYGKRRSGPQLDTDHAWIGQIEDDATSLQYLNARYYDPSTGVFISPDPIYDAARPKTHNPYNYGASNPTSTSDPSGLDPPCFHPGVSCSAGTKQSQVNAFQDFSRSMPTAGSGGSGGTLDVNEQHLADLYFEEYGSPQDFDANDTTVETFVCEIFGESCGWNQLNTLDILVTAVFESLRETTYGNWVDCATNGDPWSSDCGWVALDVALWKLPTVVKGARAARPARGASRAIVDAGKYDYLFGRVTSSGHNAARSAQNAQQLARIGVHDNAAGRSLLQNHFDDVVRSNDNVLRSFTTSHGTFQVRESLFAGPGGYLKFESTWQVTDDGMRLTTVIPLGG